MFGDTLVQHIEEMLRLIRVSITANYATLMESSASKFRLNFEKIWRLNLINFRYTSKTSSTNLSFHLKKKHQIDVNLDKLSVIVI